MYFKNHDSNYKNVFLNLKFYITYILYFVLIWILKFFCDFKYIFAFKMTYLPLLRFSSKIGETLTSILINIKDA